MAKLVTKTKDVEFPFYLHLKLFLDQEKRRIYSGFTPLSKKFLNFNNSDNARAYLRKPQFEALEMYVFLKEFCNNKFLYEIFEDWFYKKEEFLGRPEMGISNLGQIQIFSPL